MLMNACGFHPCRLTRPSLKQIHPILFPTDWVYSEGSGRRTIVKFCVLASGSSGNAALLATENTRILVDAGLSMRELRKRLASIGESLEGIDAILITHEHSDHVAGLPVLARSKDVHATIYRSEEHTSELQSRQYLVCR